MTRITNDLAYHLAKDLTTRAFRERFEAVKQRLNHAGMAAYRAHYGDETIRKMAELPEGWLCRDYRLNFKINSNCFKIPLAEWVLITYRDQNLYIFLPGNSAEAVEILNASQQSSLLTAEYDNARTETEGVIKRFSTVNRLLKEWPEIEPFAHPYAQERPAAPDFILRRLNAKLRLPAEEGA